MCVVINAAIKSGNNNNNSRLRLICFNLQPCQKMWQHMFIGIVLSLSLELFLCENTKAELFLQKSLWNICKYKFFLWETLEKLLDFCRGCYSNESLECKQQASSEQKCHAGAQGMEPWARLLGSNPSSACVLACSCACMCLGGLFTLSVLQGPLSMKKGWQCSPPASRGSLRTKWNSTRETPPMGPGKRQINAQLSSTLITWVLTVGI